MDKDKLYPADVIVDVRASYVDVIRDMNLRIENLKTSCSHTFQSGDYAWKRPPGKLASKREVCSACGKERVPGGIEE